ncbi:MAG: hypothetical protein VX438_07905 [Planctomycetota bacterium]|nr:hypothetical protein [Planctomycetota bacterium]
MNESRINIHRSFFALLVGNGIAIFLSGVVCVLVGQATHPEFFQEFKQFRGLQDQTPMDKGNDLAKESAREPRGSDGKRSAVEEPREEVAGPKLPMAFMALSLGINLVCAGLSGYVCVKIAGFAATSHGMLMVLFLVVWKIQQLLGFVENGVPAFLLAIELIALPVACLFGASIGSDIDSELAETDSELAETEVTADQTS